MQRVLVLMMIIGLGLGPELRAAEVSRADGEAVATTIATCLQTGDLTPFTTVFNGRAFMERVTAKPKDVPAELKQGFNKGFGEAFQGGLGFIQQLVGQASSYELVEVREREGSTWALMRLVGLDGALNYHDYLLQVQPDGTVKAVDVYILITGELLSESVSRFYLQAVAAGQRNVLERLMAREAALITHGPDLQAMIRHIKAGEHLKAFTLYHNLPPELKTEKFVMIMYIQAAQGVNDEAYLRAIEMVEEKYPRAAWVELLLVDAHIMRGDFKRAEASLDAMAAFTNDPYLNIMRANIRVASGQAREGRDLAMACWEAEQFIDALWTVLGVDLQLQDHVATREHLLILEQHFPGLGIGDLKDVPEYAQFVASAEYAAWMAARPTP